MRVRAIVAVGTDGSIGRQGNVPWRVPEDMRFFKRETMGHVLVMGRTTYESIGRPLPGRTNVVLSRIHPEGADEAGAIWTSDRGRALEIARSEGRDLYVAGGAKVYAAYVDLIDEWLVTRIPENVEDADTHLDASLLDGWIVVGRDEIAPGVVVDRLTRTQA